MGKIQEIHIYLTDVIMLVICLCKLSFFSSTNFVQCAAVDALKHFIPTYLVSSGEKIASDIISKYVALLDDPNVAARRGAALALGILPYNFLILKWMPVMSKLCSSCTIEVTKLPTDTCCYISIIVGLKLYFNLIYRINLMTLMLKHV
jgi:hypothetical protein